MQRGEQRGEVQLAGAGLMALRAVSDLYLNDPVGVPRDDGGQVLPH